MFSSPTPFCYQLSAMRQFHKECFASKRKSVLSCTFPCFPVSQTTKINLLLLNVVVVLLSSCRYLPRSSIGLGIFSAALKVQRNLIKCSSLSLSLACQKLAAAPSQRYSGAVTWYLSYNGLFCYCIGKMAFLVERKLYYRGKHSSMGTTNKFKLFIRPK